MNELDTKTVNISTKCKDCIFAITSDENIQNGCKISAKDDDRLQTFLGYNLAEFDPKTGYFIIKTVCNTFRKSSSVSTEGLCDSIGLSDEEEAILSSTIQIDAILVDYVNENIRKLLPITIDIINKQTIKPKMFIFVSKNYNMSYQEIYDEIDKTCTVPFKVVSVKDNNESMRGCVDIGVSKCNSTYYMLMMPNETLPEDYIEKLNKKINWELKPFSMISTQSIHGFVLQTQLHRLLGGNREMWIEDKINELAKNQNLTKMIIKNESIT